MKKLLPLIAFLLAFAPLARSQGARFDSNTLQQGTIDTTTNAVILPANPIIHFCNYPANAAPCTNLATTFTDFTLTTQCGTGTQFVLAGQSSCVSGPDAQGNWGVFVQPGLYSYTISVNGFNFGPYYLSLASSYQFGTSNIIYTGTAQYPSTAAGINAADTALGANPGSIIVTYPGSYCDTTVLLSNKHTLNFTAGLFQANIAGADSNSANVTWGVEGLGANITTGQACPASGKPFITSQNFASFTGGSNLYGVYYPVIKNMTIDGNATAPYGIQLYGHSGGPIDVVIQNTVTGTQWWEQNGLLTNRASLLGAIGSPIIMRLSQPTAAYINNPDFYLSRIDS